MRVLVVEDDPHIVTTISAHFVPRGYEVLGCQTIDDAVDLVASAAVDLVVLDLLLPETDGETVLRELRTFSDVPVIVVSALSSLDRRLRSLHTGADDYMIKPFFPEELLARVEAVGRRVHQSRASDILRFGPYEMDRTTRRLTVQGSGEVELTVSEYQILLALLENRDRTLTRAQLLARIHQTDEEASERLIDQHVSALRRKLEDDPRNPRWIRTEWGVGYRVPRDAYER